MKLRFLYISVISGGQFGQRYVDMRDGQKIRV